MLLPINILVITLSYEVHELKLLLVQLYSSLRCFSSELTSETMDHFLTFSRTPRN
jgi:hypothetical protein